MIVIMGCRRLIARFIALLFAPAVPPIDFDAIVIRASGGMTWVGKHYNPSPNDSGT